MSTAGRVGISVEPTAKPLDIPSLLQRKLTQQSDANPLRDGVAITGTTDATRPPGDQQTNGITFTTGQAIELLHNLGRPAKGFVVIDCQSSAHGLINDAPNLSAGLTNTHIRLKHTGAATTVVKVLVF